MTPSQTSGVNKMHVVVWALSPNFLYGCTDREHGVYVYKCTSNIFVYKCIYIQYMNNMYRVTMKNIHVMIGILRNSHIISSISSDICGTSFNEHLTDLRGSSQATNQFEDPSDDPSNQPSHTQQRSTFLTKNSKTSAFPQKLGLNFQKPHFMKLKQSFSKSVRHQNVPSFRPTDEPPIKKKTNLSSSQLVLELVSPHHLGLDGFMVS